MEKKILSVFAIALVVIAFTSCSKDDACMTCGTNITFDENTSYSSAEQDALETSTEVGNLEYCGDELSDAQTLWGNDDLYPDVEIENEYTVSYGCW